MHSQLLIGGLVSSPSLAHRLEQSLDDRSYRLYWATSDQDFLQWTGRNRHRVDCLLLESQASLTELLGHLLTRDILLPAILVTAAAPSDAPESTAPESTPEASSSALPKSAMQGCDMAHQYHEAVTCLSEADCPHLEQYIHQAIDQFLKLPKLTQHADQADVSSLEDTRHFLLSLQQERLTEKLRERLGYLGVYYKRNSQNFFRNLNPEEQAEFLEKLRTDYRTIILKYFAKDGKLNQRIDDFVNAAFFADISVSQIVEIHMALMDEFSKQLQLEGRSEEILLDYRLTLIDVIAHLCEMYRRSIPRDL